MSDTGPQGAPTPPYPPTPPAYQPAPQPYPYVQPGQAPQYPAMPQQYGYAQPGMGNVQYGYAVMPNVAPMQPLVGVGGWTRFGCYLLELALMTITLGFGWLVWAAMIGGTGQTPAKKLLDLRVLDLTTMRAATLGKMFWSRGFLGGLVAGFAFPVTLYILVLMPFWDDRNQTLQDKVSNTLVMRDNS